VPLVESVINAYAVEALVNSVETGEPVALFLPQGLCAAVQQTE
jgi:hypothetical protein